MGDDALARPLVAHGRRASSSRRASTSCSRRGDALLRLDAAFLFIGSGEARFERGLRELAAAYPARVGVLIGFDEALAHLVEAGADMFLMPSRFEPCGLNQMYSLRYGTVPVVHAVGGLDDTIRQYSPRSQRANGFKFREPTPDALVRAVQQAVRTYADREAWEGLMRQGMGEDHSWRNSAREYVKVYKRARRGAAIRWAE